MLMQQNFSKLNLFGMLKLFAIRKLRFSVVKMYAYVEKVMLAKYGFPGEIFAAKSPLDILTREPHYLSKNTYYSQQGYILYTFALKKQTPRIEEKFSNDPLLRDF